MSVLQNGFGGFRVVVSDPVPAYKFVSMYKKHRKKRNRMPRVRVFSHWVEMIPDGEVVQDNANGVLYMNSATAAELEKVSQPGSMR